MIEMLHLALAQGRTDIQPICGFCGSLSIGSLLTTLMVPAFSIAGLLLFFYFLWGGFKWVSSGGSKESISEAQKMITHAVIGLALLVLLFIVFRFIPEYFGVGIKLF